MVTRGLALAEADGSISVEVLLNEVLVFDMSSNTFAGMVFNVLSAVVVVALVTVVVEAVEGVMVVRDLTRTGADGSISVEVLLNEVLVDVSIKMLSGIVFNVLSAAVTDVSINTLSFRVSNIMSAVVADASTDVLSDVLTRLSDMLSDVFTRASDMLSDVLTREMIGVGVGILTGAWIMAVPALMILA